MSEFNNRKIGRTITQASIPTRSRPTNAQSAGGMLLRGVVVATYVTDDPSRQGNDSHWLGEQNPIAVYCDVLIYSGRRAGRWSVLRKVLVSQEGAGIHSGHIWKPRASTFVINTSGAGAASTIGIDGGTNPALFDGDHVLVGFIDDAANMPVILRGIPHPSCDIGAGSDPGQHLKLVLADGDPNFWRHHGTFYGVSDAGDFIIDTTQANQGDYLSNGKEPPAKNDGSRGNLTIKLQEGCSVNITIGGQTFNLSDKDSDATMTVGDGAVSIAIADHLETLYGTGASAGTEIKGTFDLHVHPSAVGPTGVPAVVMPPWDSSINSTKNKITDG